MDLSSRARRKSARGLGLVVWALATAATALANTVESTSHTAATVALGDLAKTFARTDPRPFNPMTATTTFSLGEPLAKSGARAAMSPSPALETVFTKRRRFIVASLSVLGNRLRRRGPARRCARYAFVRIQGSSCTCLPPGG